MKKTAWFPVSAKPVRTGVYETQTSVEASCGDDCGGPWFNFWSGTHWRGSARTAMEAAATRPNSKTNLPLSRWRGLTQEAA
jgi:hypothetical protein